MNKKAAESDQILDFIEDGIFTVDMNFRIVSFNKAAEKITGVPFKKAVGKSCREVFDTDLCKSGCPLRKAISSEKAFRGARINLRSASGRPLTISVDAGPLFGGDGKITGGIEQFRDISGIENLKKELSEKYSHYDIVGKSEYMRKLFDILPDIAESECNVLIEGPSGTGKSLVARTIHNLSERSRGPFVVVNCGALPENLLESELFGHTKGAFTDAKKERRGRFAAAAGGTIFLDEIAELPLHLQVKLLRVIEDRRFEPLGSSTPVTADVRIIAATNRDITRLVKSERFRDDLYYRLNIVNIRLPKLSERREDVEMLAEHFIGALNQKRSHKINDISDEVREFLASYEFPGNIRELQNILEYSFIFCKSGTLMLEHLPPEIRNMANGRTEFAEPAAAPPAGRSLESSLDSAEKTMIAETLLKFEGNRAKAARHLKIDYSTLWRKMKKYGLS